MLMWLREETCLPNSISMELKENWSGKVNVFQREMICRCSTLRTKKNVHGIDRAVAYCFNYYREVNVFNEVLTK